MPSYVIDPYFEHRLSDSLDNNRKYNVIMLIVFALISLGFALGIVDWFSLSIMLSIISMVKAYYYIQIRRFTKTLAQKRMEL